MSRCSAGTCECECAGNKGCGCWALSDDPDTCDCRCYGTAFGGGVSLPVNALVDISISGLPLLDAAKFINSIHSEEVLVPTDLLSKLNRRVLEGQTKASLRCCQALRSRDERASKEKDKAQIIAANATLPDLLRKAT
jgi:hypothetical protein